MALIGPYMMAQVADQAAAVLTTTVLVELAHLGKVMMAVMVLIIPVPAAAVAALAVMVMVLAEAGVMAAPV